MVWKGHDVAGLSLKLLAFHIDVVCLVCRVWCGRFVSDVSIVSAVCVVGVVYPLLFCFMLLLLFVGIFCYVLLWCWWCW